MIPIGKFSAACHVSVKTLRLYDSIGLLKPAYIDPKSGYRYYEGDQIDTMVSIQRYKRYGFSLDQIRSLLDLPLEEKRDVLIGRLAEINKQINDLEMIVQDLKVTIGRTERKNMEKERSSYETYQIDVRQEKRQPIYGLRETLGVGDYGTAFSKIFEHLAKVGNHSFGYTGSRYFDEEFDPNSSDIEVFVFVQEGEKNDELPAALCAHTTHKGNYSTLSEAYAAITKWIEENAYEPIGAPYEIYTKCGMNQAPIDAWETDIYFPVQKKA